MSVRKKGGRKITPRFVSELIMWAVKGIGAVEIKWDGADIMI